MMILKDLLEYRRIPENPVDWPTGGAALMT